MKKGVDYIGVTVCFYCHDGKGNLLLQKRSKNCRDEQGRWDCGGGSMNFGETFEESARREILEEYCCEPQSLVCAGVSNVIRDTEKGKTHWVAIIFAAQVDPNKVKIGEKEMMDEIGWFRIDNLPQPLHSMYKAHLEYAREYIRL